MHSLVISIFLYACESWTLTAELEKRRQAFEMKCYRRLLNILYKEHVTNEEVRRKIQAGIGTHDDVLAPVKKQKLSSFSHVSGSFYFSKDNLPRHSERKTKRQALEDVGRQYERVDRNGHCQLN